MAGKIFKMAIVRKFSKSVTKVFPELELFSNDQEKLVLEQINARSLDDFCSTKGIGRARGKAIIEHRVKHGPFLSLVDLAAIKGFGKAFFKNLLESEGVLPIQQKKHKLSNLTYLLTSQQKKTISSLVSIDIGLSNAAYVHIDRKKRILDWKRISVPVARPYNPVNCKKSVCQVVSSLPNAELYIIELQSHRASRVDPVMFPFVLHLRIVEAMFHCLLQNKLVFDMNPSVTARYFGLPTGQGKKKAAVNLISFMIRKTENMQLFEESPNAFFEKATSMQGSKETVGSILATSSMPKHMLDMKWQADIPDEILEYFMSEKKKDDLSDCLLQALAFLDLAFQE
ncbi:Transcription elongation factor, mitochondrial [Paramuricea clavata]|uniref:Transcription elongation factor, mitochondrial n=1 Tax=Paramuricea clavata TaxID=317549 RepID=A0A6S7HDS4_PARCT|nr:Transcription elongation factor, mitochondrial [Paramuricea clavata]